MELLESMFQIGTDLLRMRIVNFARNFLKLLKFIQLYDYTHVIQYSIYAER